MHVTLVNVHVKPEHLDDFIAATRLNHLASIEESGNLRFDVLQDIADPCRFILYEAYTNDAQAAAHKQMPHYLHWHAAVAKWMALPREGMVYHGLCP